MSRPCKACTSPANSKAISQKMRSGTTLVDIARWLASIGDPISRNALARHKPHIGLGLGTPGPRPRSDSFLADVVGTAHDDLSAGLLRPSIRDAIGAQGELNKMSARDADHDLMLRIAITLGGRRDPNRLPDPEVAAIEAEFLPLLEARND